jgi:hypothetical protein
MNASSRTIAVIALALRAVGCDAGSNSMPEEAS